MQPDGYKFKAEVQADTSCTPLVDAGARLAASSPPASESATRRRQAEAVCGRARGAPRPARRPAGAAPHPALFRPLPTHPCRRPSSVHAPWLPIARPPLTASSPPASATTQRAGARQKPAAAVPEEPRALPAALLAQHCRRSGWAQPRFERAKQPGRGGGEAGGGGGGGRAWWYSVTLDLGTAKWVPSPLPPLASNALPLPLPPPPLSPLPPSPPPTHPPSCK